MYVIRVRVYKILNGGLLHGNTARVHALRFPSNDNKLLHSDVQLSVGRCVPSARRNRLDDVISKLSAVRYVYYYQQNLTVSSLLRKRRVENKPFSLQCVLITRLSDQWSNGEKFNHSSWVGDPRALETTRTVSISSFFTYTYAREDWKICKSIHALNRCARNTEYSSPLVRYYWNYHTPQY